MADGKNLKKLACLKNWGVTISAKFHLKKPTRFRFIRKIDRYNDPCKKFGMSG